MKKLSMGIHGRLHQALNIFRRNYEVGGERVQRIGICVDLNNFKYFDMKRIEKEAADMYIRVKLNGAVLSVTIDADRLPLHVKQAYKIKR